MKKLKKRASSHEDHFPKTVFTLPQCRIAKDDSYGDLLSWLQMRINEQDEVALVAHEQRRWKPRCAGGSWLFVGTRSVGAARIYRKDPPMVTTSHNRLGLSPSKHIRYKLVAKINGKRKLRTCVSLGQILVDHSCARYPPAPIASPCDAMHYPARPDEQARVCFSLSPLLHTLVCA
jgi:hypothetical protein